jgi:hypothetical protein
LKLNQYAEQVRADINPRYFLKEGRFLIYDDMGVWCGGRPTVIDPYPAMVRKHLKKYALPIEKKLLG